MTTSAALTLPRTAAAQSALAHQVRELAPDHGVEEAINMVAQNVKKDVGGDIFWALAHVGAAHRNACALQAEMPDFDNATSGCCSFGS